MAAAITLLGYGTLVWSSYPPLRSIGIVSTVSVVALAAASVLVLPALLMRDVGAVSAVRVAALIPAFNEAGTIGAVVGGLRGAVAEIIVVDDGSTDDTAAARARGRRAR